MDKLNADGNLIGRLGALVLIAVVAIVVGRVAGMNVMCPLGAGKACCFSQAAQLKGDVTAKAAPAAPAKK